MFLYPSADPATATYDAALAFTHGDHYKPVAGYQVMNHHYHMDLGQRLGAAGSLDADIPDLVALKALGINIVSQIDSVGGGAEGTPPGALYPGGRPVPAVRQQRRLPLPPAAAGRRPICHRADEALVPVRPLRLAAAAAEATSCRFATTRSKARGGIRMRTFS